MRTVTGLHHVTAISGPAQENLDFYAGLLGMRLVKKSVNQDDPSTYHLFYADAEGHPGTDLTFFPWAHMAPGRPGHGVATEVQLAVPPGTLDWWGTRLSRYGVQLSMPETRFGERVLPMVDTHGQAIALVEAHDYASRTFTPWEESPVPVAQQIRGLHGARLVERDLGPTAFFLVNTLGFEHVASGTATRSRVAARGVPSTCARTSRTGAATGAWAASTTWRGAWTTKRTNSR
jgi:glyoxalase family protein